MGMNLDCALFFGFDLGGPGDGWKMFAKENAETYEHEWPEWVKSIDEGEDHPDDIDGDIIDVLLGKMTDFEVIDWNYEGENPRPDDYYRRLRDAKDELGITTDVYGAYDFMGTVLGFCLLQGDWGVKEVDPDAIEGMAFEYMRTKLREALVHLGIPEDEQPEPKLLMLSSYF